MLERFTQQDRFARLVTPLGEDVLVLVKLDAVEAISENFEWRISCLLNEGEEPVDAQALIGQQAHVALDTDSGTTRYFPGLCTDVRFRGWRGDYMYYDLTLRPRSEERRVGKERKSAQATHAKQKRRHKIARGHEVEH